MTSIIHEGKDSILVIGGAVLVQDERETAWAEKFIRADKNLKWVLGNFVMADIANDNGHIFPLTDLQNGATETITHKPLNLLHQPEKIVGHYAGAELMYPVSEGSDSKIVTPYVEALAAFYHYYFPQQWEKVEAAHGQGALHFSMECVPERLICGLDECGKEFAYMGRQSPTYCDHLREPVAKRHLVHPHFTGGALILPPVRPGWKDADIKELSELVESDPQAAEVYESVAANSPHLEPKQWEEIMLSILEYARDFSTEKRKGMAKKGTALPDGSFPIANAEDLENAIRLAGKAKNPAAARAHIRKRAKALGLGSKIPDSW